MTSMNDELDLGEVTLIDLLGWRAAHQGEREVFSFLPNGEGDPIVLSFSQLDHWARGIAARLQAVVPEGERTIILCPPGLDYQAAFYGAICAGQIAVPYYPPRPEASVDPLAHVLRSTRPAAALLPFGQVDVEELCGRLPALGELHLIDTEGVTEEEADRWHTPAISGDSIAALFMSSGSTSEPKGVMHSHRTLIAGGHLTEPYYPDEGMTRSVTWVPPQFTFALVYTLYAVQAAMTVTFMPPAAVLENPVRWLRAISSSRATHSAAPNYAYDLCTHLITEEEKQDLELSSVVGLASGGEQVRADTLQRFSEAFAPCGLRPNVFTAGYGLTECMGISVTPKGGALRAYTFDRTALESNRAVTLPRDEDHRGRYLVSCGELLKGLTVLLVDPETHRLCGPDEVGEVWVAGPSVAVGYWEQPDETARVFHATHPVTGDGSFLRTGDLGFLHEGELYITGRHKEMIIIRGRNMYPVDIELTVQGSTPELRPNAGAAFSVEEDDKERLVVVYEVENSVPVQRLPDIASAARAALAREQGVNAHAVLLLPPGTLPKTSSGKIRRKACRDAYLAGTVETRYQSLRDEVGGLAGRVGALPRTPVEEALAGVWHKVLGVETIGIHDDFFALGGDSLLVMQIVAGCRAAGLGVTPEQIFQHPTIARLAAIAATEPVGRVTGTERVVGPVPLLPRQRQLFAQHENRVPDRDVLPITLGADAHIDSTLLEEAVRLVMDHHDSLRMRFQLDSDSWTQECLDRVEYDVVKTVDISNLTSGERKAAIKSETARLRESIDIEKGRLVRIAHFDSGTDRATRLVLIVHHLAVDSYCLPTVVEDLETAYRALATKQPVRLPPRTTSVRAWVERLVEIAESEEMRDEAAYWAEMVTRQRGDITPDYPDWAGTRGARERVTISLSQPETDALLRTLPRETGIQLTDALCAAVATSYASLTGFETVAVGLANHGRERVYDDIDLSRTVGFFTSSFPAILDVPGMDTPRLEVARRLREQIDRIPRHGLGLGVVRYLYRGPEREIVRAAPHPVLGLNYQGRFDRLYSGLSLLRPEGESSSEPTSGRPVRATPRIQVAARIQGDSLHVVCNYHERVYAEETIRRLAERVGAVLTAFAGEVTGAVVAGEPVSP